MAPRSPPLTPPQVAGRWQLTMDTPAGVKTPLLTLIDLGGGRYTGTLAQPDRETGIVSEVKLQGSKLTFASSGKLLVPVTFHFEFTVQGDRLDGSTRLGFLPPSKVTGVRAK